MRGQSLLSGEKGKTYFRESHSKAYQADYLEAMDYRVK